MIRTVRKIFDQLDLAGDPVDGFGLIYDSLNRCFVAVPSGTTIIRKISEKTTWHVTYTTITKTSQPTTWNVVGYPPRIFYVSTTGNDANAGTQGAPFRTLQFAAELVSAGDTVRVKAGNYVGFVLGFENHVPVGEAARRITFMADEPGVIINQKNPRSADGINFEPGVDYVTLDGFTVLNVLEDMTRACIRFVDCSNIQIRNCRCNKGGRWGIAAFFCDYAIIEDNECSNSVREHGIYHGNSCIGSIIRRNVLWGNGQAGVHLNGDESLGPPRRGTDSGFGMMLDILVEQNVIYENGKRGGSGVNCDGLKDSIIRNNLIYNNHASGISLYKDNALAGATGNLVHNNTVVQAVDGRYCFNMYIGSINNTVLNNIFFHPGTKGCMTIGTDSIPGLVSDYNIIDGKFLIDDSAEATFGYWRNITNGQDLNTIEITNVDSLFIDRANSDYHLTSSSLAKDKGTLIAGTDLDGNPRTYGVTTDIGAFEYNPTLPFIVSRSPVPASINQVPAKIDVVFNIEVDPNTAVFSILNGNNVIPGTVSYANPVLSFTPSSPFPPASKISVTLSGVQDLEGNPSPKTKWVFSTQDIPSAGPFTLFHLSDVPAFPTYNDFTSLTLGLQFSVSLPSQLIGFRFYKGVGNFEPHIASIWSNAGALIQAVLFVGEDEEGWQTQNLVTPVNLTGTIKYVAGYTASFGRYSVDLNAFSAPLAIPPITVHQGRFSNGNIFPSTFSSSSYGFDILVYCQNPLPNATNVIRNGSIIVPFNQDIDPNSVVFTLSPSVSTTRFYDSTTRTLRFVPSANLAANTLYTATVSGATSPVTGYAMSGSLSWQFTTGTVVIDPTSRIWQNTDIPPNASSHDSNSYTLGTTFTTSVPGIVTKIRFYKDADVVGTHNARLYDDTGLLLASKDFSGETTSGWQEVTLDTPISLSVGKTYTVAYKLPTGAPYYIATPAYFTSPRVSNALTATAGVFKTGDGFPNESFNNTNYWVDVEFVAI